MKTLTEIANEIGTDKGTIVAEKHSYTEAYEKYFSSYKDKEYRMFEIGINDPRFPGASIKLWSSYFSKLYFLGYDITDCKHFEKPDQNIFTFQGDQNNPEHLKNAIELHGNKWDVIIDDGSHFHEHQITSFNTLYQYVKPGGLYVIEDLHWADGKQTLDMFLQNQAYFDFEVYCDNKLLIIKK
jgi:demethylmacrocin O-methyltransferase